MKTAYKIMLLKAHCIQQQILIFAGFFLKNGLSVKHKHIQISKNIGINIRFRMN